MQARADRDLLYYRPELGGVIDILNETGAPPVYYDGIPIPTISPVLPYDGSETILTVGEIRVGVKEGRFLILSSYLVDLNVPMVETPTTNALDGLPDISIPIEVRIIADLR